jgi:predicted RNase H-like nuclease
LKTGLGKSTENCYATSEPERLIERIGTGDYPVSYTLGEAAKATGMSKAAISRAIKNHAISAEKQDNGSYKIDPAELHRVYPAISTQQAEQQVKPRSTSASDATELNAENRELRAKLEAATQRLNDKDTVIDDLREDRDRWRTQAEKLLLTDQRAQMITPPPEPTAQTLAPAKRRWWGGRG